MVGSDLEDGGDKGPEYGFAGTRDFLELIDGYQSLPDDHGVEVMVAFGGSDKDGWRGMKIANMRQLTADLQDGAFGNETDPDAYLYTNDQDNMGDEESLTFFLSFLDLLEDGFDFDQRFLTFWNHGGSYTGFGGDTNWDSDLLHMDEITRAFDVSQPGVFDLIGFDACYMASVEVAKVIQPHARYMIASEELEPGHGWLWSAVIQFYAEQDDIVEVGKLMVDNFVQDVHGSVAKEKTLSLLDLDRYDELVGSLNSVVELLDNQILFDDEYAVPVASSIVAARSYNESNRGDYRTSIDLMHFAELLAAEYVDTELSPPLEELMNEIDRFVVHSAHHPSISNAHGISIDAPENKDQLPQYKINNIWLNFQSTYANLLRSDTTAPVVVEQTTDDTGTYATFSDDYLTEATVLYGFIESIEYDDGSVAEVFTVVAELEAQSTGTEGEYFTPRWDQWWFTVEYDPNEITAWIPASFIGYGEDEFGPYSIYTAEIDFYIGDSETPEFAELSLYIDDDGQVFDHSVQTYRYIDEEETIIQFDKATYQIEVGDAVEFYSYTYNLDDSGYDAWLSTGEFAEFVQDPVFHLEYLEFVDELDQPFEYYYTIWAEDASGNGVFTDLVPVE